MPTTIELDSGVKLILDFRGMTSAPTEPQVSWLATGASDAGPAPTIGGAPGGPTPIIGTQVAAAMAATDAGPAPTFGAAQGGTAASPAVSSVSVQAASGESAGAAPSR